MVIGVPMSLKLLGVGDMSNGWKLVPVEPDLEMRNEAWRELDEQGVDIVKVEVAAVLRRAIAAAPQPPSVGDLPGLPDKQEIERPRTQPNSWDDWNMGYNACRKDCKPAITARDQQIARLRLNISEMNDEAKLREGQIAELRARVTELDQHLTNKGIHLGVIGERLLAALAQQVNKP